MKPRSESRSKIAACLKCPAGQGLLEYSILLMLIAFVVVVGLRLFGASVNSGLYEPINNAVTNAGR